MAKITFKRFIGIGGDAHRPDMEDFCIEESLGVFFNIVDKRMDKILRLAATGANKYSIPTIDTAEDFLLGCKLLGIFLFHLI